MVARSSRNPVFSGFLPRFAPRAGAVLVATLATVACGAPDGRDLEDLVRQDGLYLAPETMQPYSGLAFASFHAASTSGTAGLHLWSGAYHGPFESYFRSRDLSARETYVDGVRHGPFESYFESGALFEEGTYEAGRREGTYRAYWESGELYEEGTYRAGFFDGPRRWYKDGRLVEMVTYRGGVMHGLYERYREDGSLDLKGMLEEGTPCGVWFEDDRTISYPVCGGRATE
jgi:hypothetical protein